MLTAASPSCGPLRPGTDRSGHGTEAPTPARLAQGRMGSGHRPRVPRQNRLKEWRGVELCWPSTVAGQWKGLKTLEAINR